MKTFSSCIGLVVLMVVMVAVTAILRGWALAMLWGWFVAPTFEIHALTIVEAIGIGLVFNLMQTSTADAKKKDGATKDWTDILGDYLGYGVFVPLAAVGLGYIIKMFM